jgi:hypothetical protein
LRSRLTAALTTALSLLALLTLLPLLALLALLALTTLLPLLSLLALALLALLSLTSLLLPLPLLTWAAFLTRLPAVPVQGFESLADALGGAQGFP